MQRPVLTLAACAPPPLAMQRLVLPLRISSATQLLAARYAPARNAATHAQLHRSPAPRSARRPRAQCSGPCSPCTASPQPGSSQRGPPPCAMQRPMLPLAALPQTGSSQPGPPPRAMQRAVPPPRSSTAAYLPAARAAPVRNAAARTHPSSLRSAPVRNAAARTPPHGFTADRLLAARAAPVRNAAAHAPLAASPQSGSSL
jgi:hypothetical protein